MKYLNPNHLPFVTLCLGALGLTLHVDLLTLGVDSKGLLVTGSWMESLSWGCAGSMAVVLALGIRSLDGIPKNERLFPASAAAALGNVPGAVGFGITAIRLLLDAGSPFHTAAAISGFAAALCLVALAFCRWKGQKISLLARLPVILFLALFSLSQYRGWSAATQTMEYAFPMLATVFLILTSYHRPALEVRLHGRKSYVFCNLAALFFSMLAIPHAPLFYLPMAVWMASDICSLRVMTKRVTPRQEDAPEED